jgi:hypothetical protein
MMDYNYMDIKELLDLSEALGATMERSILYSIKEEAKCLIL